MAAEFAVLTSAGGVSIVERMLAELYQHTRGVLLGGNSEGQECLFWDRVNRYLGRPRARKRIGRFDDLSVYHLSCSVPSALFVEGACMLAIGDQSARQ